MSGKVDLVIESVTDLLKDISSQTLAFERSVAYKCRPGCGAGCTKPSIEAQVVEMLPMAKHLIDTEKLDEAFGRLSLGLDQSCILYEPSPDDRNKGRYLAYDFRPSICRLFGFSAVKRKSGAHELATCAVHKEIYPDEVRSAQINVEKGLPVPVVSEHNFQLRNLASESSIEFSMPINRALKLAIEKLMLSRQYLADESIDLSVTESVPLYPEALSDLHLQ